MQRGTKSAILPISQRCRADRMFNVPRLHAKIATDIKSFSLFILANNIFDIEYFEKDNVIMPRSNFEFGLTYTFR